MESRRASFRPPLWATCLTIGLAGAFIALGLWQLRRADEKRAFFAAFDQQGPATAQPGPLPDSAVAANRFAWIRVTGHYDPLHQLLLDAQVRDGQAGYQVLTPLISTGPQAVLVNRGWVPAAPDRRRLPELAVDGGLRTVNGRVNPLPVPALRTAPAIGQSGASSESGWPRRLLFPTAAEITAATGFAVHDYEVLLGPGEADGYLREWRPQVMKPEQHLAYALQWFALATALGVVYVAVNLKRPQEPR